MSQTLPPVLARELDRWARELLVGGGGLLMVAVGVSAARRHAIDARLGVALEGWNVVRVSVGGACLDPWGQVLASVPEDAAHTLVSLVGVSDCEDPERTLAALNLGREHLRRGSISLVLWAGLEELDRVRRKAPDLWSYRRRVGFFLAAEDFDLTRIEVDESQTITARIGEVQARLDTLEDDDPHRVQLLLRLVDHFHQLGDKASAAAALDKVAVLVGEDSPQADRAGLLRARVSSAHQFERLGEMLTWSEPINWSVLDSATARVAAFYAMIAYARRGKFAEAERASTRARRLYESFEPPARASLDANEAAAWLSLGDLLRARQRCVHAMQALGGRWILDASFIAQHQADIARARLDSHAALIAEHEALSLRSDIAALGLIAGSAIQVIADYRALGLFDDAERLCVVALAENLVEFEHIVALTSELIQTQACRDLSAARETHQAILQQLEQRITTCPGWERAMLRRARVKLLQLSFELDPQHADELRRVCLDELDLTAHDAIEQRQFDLAQWARLQQVELTRALHAFPRSLALASTALDWATEHEGPSRITQCHIELATTHRLAHEFEAAAEQLEMAEHPLSAENPLYQPRETWKRLLIERHQLALARPDPDPPAALAHLEHALTRMRAAGLRKLELELLHLVAELPDHPTTNPRRHHAAREALELARDAYLVFEEARALANLAIIEYEQAPALARRRLDDALELAPSCVFEPAHKRLREAERQLAEPIGQ